MPLNPTELAKVHEIVGLSDYDLEDVEGLAAPLSDEQLTLMRADIAEWDEEKFKDTKVKGGRDGIDVDPDRKLRKIRRRVLAKLGIAAGGTGGIRMIPVASGWAR